MSVERGEVTMRTASCANPGAGSASASEGEVMDLSRSRSQRWWVLVAIVQDAMSLLVLVLSPSSRIEASLVLMWLPPGSYTNLLLLPVPKLLGLREWSWTLLLSLMSVLGLLCAFLPSMALLGLLRLSWGACTCGFVIGSASSLPMLETLASCAWWLFGFASVSSDG